MSTLGKFITFEGGEGAGKSTQCTLLASHLKDKGIDVLVTREPGGTPSAEMIRKLLVEGDINRWQSSTEALLMFAARSEHWHTRIHPALQKGTWVISDRFVDSSYAYQGYARGIPLEQLEKLYQFAVGSVYPDLTFFLNIPLNQGFERVRNRVTSYEERFEKEALSFHEKVQNGFLDLAKKFKERYIVEDATRSIHVIAQSLQNEIHRRFSI
ncbi:MAG: dTMP kinase [Alphaproteobacteria bacterium CG_4_10_14_0_8_um_filter_37_21]|nr:MAG: dTMP kinase [Alphaproteobacteria bacterium CG_4_10_14_0_8_um_filter_37_21]